MLGQPKQVTVKEIRFSGDCPWCGNQAVPLRDYMCYNAVKPCCHEMYRKLQPKAFAALRKFPNRSVNISTQFDSLVEKFYECIQEDKRFLQEIKGPLSRIEEMLAEYESDLRELLQFLVRLYITRGILNLNTDQEGVQRQCLVCGRELYETWRYEICSSCLNSIGTPPDPVSVDKPAPISSQKRQGMHITKR